MRQGAKAEGAVIGGYALLLVFFGLFTGRVNLLFFGENVQVVFPLYAHAAEVGQFCCLFCFAFLSLIRQRIAERLAPCAAFVFLISGYAFTLYQAVGSDTPPLLSVAAGVLFGAGQGACFLCWFLVYARMEVVQVMRTMVASTVLSGMILLAIGCIPETIMLFSVLSIIVAACVALTFHCLSAVPSAAHNRNPVAEEQAKNYAESGRRFRSWAFLERRSLLCLVAIAFVCGAQRVISLEGFLPQMAVQALFSVGYIVGALVFFGMGKVSGAKNNFYRMYSTLLVVMATCGVLSSFRNVEVQSVLYAIDNIAFAIVSMCMIVTCLKGVRGFWNNSLFIGGIVCGVMYFAIQLGRMVCVLVAEFIGMDAVGVLIVSVIILYVVSLAAISSGLFVRQAVKSGNVMGPASGCEGDSAGVPTQRVIISVANVTEEELRGNPVYRNQYKLTDREIDVAVLLLAGYNATDIAKILTVSVNTVKTHAKNLYAKTGVHNRRELIDLLNEIENA